MKRYKCPYGKHEWTTRKEARKQIQGYIKTNKKDRESKRRGSNITEKMIREEI